MDKEETFFLHGIKRQCDQSIFYQEEKKRFIVILHTLELEKIIDNIIHLKLLFFFLDETFYA